MENNELVVLAEVRYPVSIDEITAFKAKWAEVPTLEAEAGIKDPQFLEVRSAHLEAVRFRTSIEKKRKELKEPALAYGKQVDGIAKEYTTLLEDTELALFKERNKVERYEQEQEQLRINAEMERVALIGTKIYALQSILSNAIGKCSADLKEIYESVVMPEEEIYQERTDEAMEIYKSTLLKLEGMVEQAYKAEQADILNAEAEAKRKAEDAQREAAVNKEREAFEKEKAAYEAEKNAKIEAEALKRAEQEAEEYAKQQAEAEASHQKILDELEEQRLADVEYHQMQAIEKRVESIEESKAAMKYIVEQWAGQPEIGEGGVAEVILQAILDEKIPHVKWSV